MRPTNKHSVYTHRNTFEETLAFDAAETHLWEVDVEAIPTVTFKDIYPDGHNEVDQPARDWLLAMFDYMCPVAVDSDVFSKVDKYEEDAWSRVELPTDEGDEGDEGDEAGAEDDEDEDDGFEDGWHGILLSAVFVVKGEDYSDILNRAGFRVLQHEDTRTVVAQVTFCGMSNEHSRAHAGFLLCADRDWPILTKRGWCRPVA
jgi:hypothetical protein